MVFQYLGMALTISNMSQKSFRNALGGVSPPRRRMAKRLSEEPSTGSAVVSAKVGHPIGQALSGFPWAAGHLCDGCASPSQART
jgi:hypothetical protein